MRTLLFAIIFGIPLAAKAEKDRIDVGDEAPAFTAKTLNPETAQAKIFSLDTAVGPDATEKKKVVLVSFAQSSCESCLKELSFLEALYSEYKGKGLLVLSVVSDREDADKKKTSDALSAVKVDYPVLDDRFNIVAKRYFATKPPSLFIIDENGRIAKSASAYDDSANAEIIGEVRKNLGLSTADPVPPALASFVRGAGGNVTITKVEEPAAADPATVDEAAPPKKGGKGKKPPKAPKAKKPPPVKGPKKVGRKPAP